MYLPLLRGKQFELLALRELSQLLMENQTKLSPIIEPVRNTFPNLMRLLEVFKENNINFNLVFNPLVGQLIGRQDEILNALRSLLEDYSNYQVSFYINEHNSPKSALELVEKMVSKFSGFCFIHRSALDDLALLKKFDRYNKTIYNIIDFDNTNRRYHRNFNPKTLVSLEDQFNILQKNIDYIKNDDELFTEEHLHYREEGFIGFSDYLTIGEEYSETGFLPYAVVIHLTYADEQKRIRIHHFVSDSNDDTSDIAGKFAEAIEKMHVWLSNHEVQETIALNEFRNLYKEEHFPGLGYIKKLSIKHHLELMTSIL